MCIRKKKLSELITDDSGKLSAGRFIMFISSIVYLSGVIYILVTKGDLVDLPVGAVGFIVGLYAGNKFSPTNPYNGGDK